MLVLTRCEGERILIGSDIVITCVRVGRTSVRIGVEAPKDMVIIRDELQLPPVPAEAATG